MPGIAHAGNPMPLLPYSQEKNFALQAILKP